MSNDRDWENTISPLMAGIVGGATVLVALLLIDEKYRSKIKKVFHDLQDSGEKIRDIAVDKLEKLEEIHAQLTESQDEKSAKKKQEIIRDNQS